MFWVVCVLPHEVVILHDESLKRLLERVETEIKHDDTQLYFFKGEKLDIRRQNVVCYSKVASDKSSVKHYHIIKHKDGAWVKEP